MTLEKGVEAVDRALTILASFLDAASGLTLHEISLKTGFYKSTILRLCASLENFGYLNRSEDGRYRLGSTCANLGAVYQATFDLGEFVRPVLHQLVAATNETASFYVRAKEGRVCLYRVNSTLATRHHVEEGEQLPLEVGAAGLALLAAGGEKGERFDRVRRDRFALTLAERDPDAASIASPIFGGDGRCVGALAVSGLLSRFTPERIEPLKQHLLEAVSKLEGKLGRVRG